MKLIKSVFALRVAQGTCVVMELTHLTDEALELYSLNHPLSEEELAIIETHLVSCEWCRQRCEDLKEDADPLRDALRLKKQETESKKSLFLVVGSKTPRKRPN
jgi:predicted anti-sigma-YlaC factor YlaD